MKVFAELTVYAGEAFFSIENPTVTVIEMDAYAEGVSYVTLSQLFRLRMMLAAARASSNAAAAFERFRTMSGSGLASSTATARSNRPRDISASASHTAVASSTFTRVRGLVAEALSKLDRVVADVRVRSLLTTPSRGTSGGSASTLTRITSWRSPAIWNTPGLTWEG